jgi:hypothetical protein
MADWHLAELRNALTKKGWRILAEHPGDHYRVSGSWAIQRSTKFSPVWIDFEGMDKSGDGCLPMAQSYGCKVRGHETTALYFGKSRPKWKNERQRFVESLDLLG